MHLLETYALSTGSKIKKPFIIKKFFPLPSEKYITIQNSSGMNGKCYDYFQDIIDFIYEKLEINGFKIIQIGNKEDKPLNRVVNLCGQTDINQTAFILENSKLHIGNDSFAIHMSSAFDVPLIGLYSVSSPEIAGPFWKNNKQICLTPKNWKPSFNPNESPKRVNEIPIEEVLNAINLLLFNNNKKDLTSLYKGSNYHNLILESYPDQIIPPNLFPNHLINIRVDYIKNIHDKDYNGLFNNLNIRPCSIITDKYINLQPLLNFKNKIPNIFYNITNNIDLNFIKELNFYGFNFIYIFDFEDNEEILNQRKLELIEYPQIIEVVQKSKLNINYKDNLFYKSNKLLFSNNKAYISKLAEKNDTPILNLNDLWIKSISSQEELNYLGKDDANFIFIFEK